MPRPPTKEVLKHLANRGDVLQCLNGGIYDSRKISDNIGKSRSSVDRDIRLLKDDDFIVEHPDGYTLTRYGEFALDVYQLTDHLGTAKQLVLHLPSNTPLLLMRDATIKETGGPLPQQPIEHMVNLIGAGYNVEMITPAVIPAVIDGILKRVRSGDLTIDLIATSKVVEELLNTYSEETRANLQTERFTLRKSKGNLSFGLIVVDGEIVCLAVFDGSMRLLGTITNNSTQTTEWAQDTFGEHQNRSQEVFFRGTTHSGNRKSRPKHLSN